MTKPNTLALSVALSIAAAATATGCSHDTKSAFKDIEGDSSLSDEQALVKMAKASWLFAVGPNIQFKATKTAKGKFLLTGFKKDSIGVTPMSDETFMPITTALDAKYVWRLFRGGLGRGLDEVLYTHKLSLLPDGEMDLYQVRVSAAQLKSVAGWDTADPFSVNEYDVLDTPEALQVTAGIVKAWTMVFNNKDKLKIN